MNLCQFFDHFSSTKRWVQGFLSEEIKFIFIYLANLLRKAGKNLTGDPHSSMTVSP
jgi:hypothetical protein